MTYQISHKRQKEIPASYFADKETERLRKKYHGKIPPFLEITREGMRRTSGVIERVHKKGAIVEYKDGIAQVKKVTKRGLWIEPYRKPRDNSIAYPSGKVIFISEKRVEKGEVYPFFVNFPVYANPTFVIE
jgi:hypothetical protein